MLTARTEEHGGRLRKYRRITDPGPGMIGDFKSRRKEAASFYEFVIKEDRHGNKRISFPGGGNDCRRRRRLFLPG